MIILFQNILVLKEVIACNGCFGFFNKIKKESGTSFWCRFSAWFCHKNVLYLCSLLTDKVSMSYLFSFSRYQIKSFFKFLFRQLMVPQTLRFILDQALKHWLTGRKRGKMEIQKSEYLQNENSFLDENRWNKKHLS